MKKATIGILISCLFLAIFVLGFDYQKNTLPNTYYKIYLNEKLLGTIEDKDKLNEYIDKEGSSIKKKYDVSRVYAPKGLQIEKATTYNNNLDSVPEIYHKIKNQETFTVDGYEFKIKKEVTVDEKKQIGTKKIYVLDKKIFKKAVELLIDTFIGEERYEAYINNNQLKIETTGENLENIYLGEDVTVKQTKIPVSEKIYKDTNELSQFLLFGDNNKTSTYTVKKGDTVKEVAFNNKVSTQELLISNETLTSTDNLLYPGQQLVIAETNPQLSVVSEAYVVKDIESAYKTEEKYDSSMMLGDEVVTRQGENGLIRVTQKEKRVNGALTFVVPQSKEVLKEAVNKVIVKGKKYVPSIGSLSNWGWPTENGWTLSSDFSYRNNPFGRGRELHTGIDLSGTGYGSKIYSANNGVIYKSEYHYSYGNYVVVNHNNGYYTVYAHMSRIAPNMKVGRTVERGEVLGYVGMTGSATGPHLHFEVWKGCDYCQISPWTLYR